MNPKLCDEAIIYSTYVQNRAPHKTLHGKTPYVSWSGHKPNVSHFRVFGSKAWARIPPKKRKASQHQIKEYIMVVYVEYVKGYNIFYPSSQKTFTKRSVQFKEEPMQEIELVKGGLLTPSTQ